MSEQEGQVFLSSDEYAESDWSTGGGAPGVKTTNLVPASDLGVEDGDPLLATATNADGNTSEFSVQAHSVANESDEAAVPEASALHAPYPNPTSGWATLPFDLTEAGPVRLAVYDVLGREVAALVDEDRPAGQHEAVLDAAALPSGPYLVRLTAGAERQMRKLLLVR